MLNYGNLYEHFQEIFGNIIRNVIEIMWKYLVIEIEIIGNEKCIEMSINTGCSKNMLHPVQTNECLIKMSFMFTSA